MYSKWTQSRRKSLESVLLTWAGICCGCCGFSSEIMHFLIPLQKRLRTRTTMAPECFCPGSPDVKSRTIELMQIPPQSYRTTYSKTHQLSIWVLHTDPLVYHHRLMPNHPADYKVGRSMYEFNKLPDRWASALNTEVDEVWVPCTFVRDVFINSGVHPHHLHIIPEAIDTNLYNPDVVEPFPLPPQRQDFLAYDSMHSAATRTHYKFLSVFKWEDRKGWDTLLTAYFTAFTRNDPVSLYIVTHIWFPGDPASYGDQRDHNHLASIIKGFAKNHSFDIDNLPHFVIITEDLPETHIVSIYRAVDAFVLPTRGEGWGLPVIQALAMGLPTICTNYSGMLDFATPDTAYLIPIDGLEELPKDTVYGYQPGKKWAVPNVRATTRLMRHVYEQRDEARELGRAARRYVVEHFSEDAVAEIVVRRLEEIRARVH